MFDIPSVELYDNRDDITLGTRIIDGDHSDLNMIPPQETVDYQGLTPDYDHKKDYKLIANILRNVHQHEMDRKLPIELKARACWELYHSNFEASDSEKADWQSKKAFPIFFMTVERFAANFSKLREQNSNWFEVESMIPTQQVYFNLCKNFAQLQLDHPDVGFGEVEKDFIRNGLNSAQSYVMVTYDIDDNPILSGVEDTSPDVNEMPNIFNTFDNNENENNPFPDSSEFPFIEGPDLPRLHLQNLDPSKVWLDTMSGRDKYKIWETVLTVGEFLDEAKKRGYDLAACKRAAHVGVPARVADCVDDFQQNVGSDRTAMNKSKVLLTHFEGTLTDIETGVDYVTKSYMVMCNDVEIVLKPVPIPFWDKKSAIVASPFIKVPNAVYGKSPMTENIDAFETRHELLNLILDFFQRSLSPAYECEIDRLHPDEGGEMGDLYPGRVVNTMNNGVSGDRPVIRPVMLADLPQGFWQFLQFFQTTFSEFSGMTQELMGMPRTRGRVTGMEFQSRQSQSGDLIIDWFKGLEERLYQKILHLVFLRGLQYTPQNMWKTWVISSIPKIVGTNVDPKLAEQWKKALIECSNWTPQERFRRLGGMFRFKVKIFSSLMERQQVIEQSTFFIQTIGKVPEMLKFIRLDKILLKITTAFGWDPEEVLKLEVVPTPEAEFELLKDLTERGQAVIAESGFSIPDMMNGAGGMFGIDPAMFGSEPIDDGLSQDVKMNTESGSPFSGTGAPKNFTPSMLGGMG